MPSLRTRLFQVYARLRRPMTLGVRGLVENADGHVLLVRHTYIAGWHMPGGGVERGEPAHEALCRELAEEAGVAVTGPVELIGVYSNHHWFRGDHVVLYAVRNWAPCATDHEGEIEDVGWFAPDALPSGTTPATRRRILEFAGDGEPAHHW